MFKYNFLPKGNKGGASLKRSVINAIIYIVLIVLSIIWLFPFFYLVVTSLRIDIKGVPGDLFPSASNIEKLGFSGCFGFDNYIALFTEVDNGLYKYQTNDFFTWYLNTLMISLVTAVISTILTLMTAYTLSRLRFKGRKGLMRFMLILGMFPGFLTMIAIYNLMKMIGLQSSLFGLILIYISGSAMGYYISKGFFDTISKSLDEAARIDGASNNVIFWKIILPLSKPIVVYTVLTAFLGPWGDFMMSNYLLGNDKTKYTVSMGMQRWIDASNQSEYFTRFCAAGVVVSIPIVILFFWLQRYYVEGVTGGAVKG